MKYKLSLRVKKKLISGLGLRFENQEKSSCYELNHRLDQRQMDGDGPLVSCAVLLRRASACRPDGLSLSSCVPESKSSTAWLQAFGCLTKQQHSGFTAPGAVCHC
ncbi:uncharacterized protein V6R79_025735 [Siganus canaliculatus]